jgi:hypothetical protein
MAECERRALHIPALASHSLKLSELRASYTSKRPLAHPTLLSAAVPKPASTVLVATSLYEAMSDAALVVLAEANASAAAQQ